MTRRARREKTACLKAFKRRLKATLGPLSPGYRRVTRIRDWPWASGARLLTYCSVDFAVGPDKTVRCLATVAALTPAGKEKE